MEPCWSLLTSSTVSGPQLRQDDPTALKQIIQLVQEAQKQKDASMIRCAALLVAL